ncbi:MAG: DHH family phosphoesterase [Holosporales bacterium]
MSVIITSGWKYSDIDVLASGIALKELFEHEKEEVYLCLPGPFNASIVPEMKGWVGDQLSAHPPEHAMNSQVILVDISDPHHVAPFVVVDNVVEVFDHHHGYENFWQQRIGAKAKIVPIGACATLIWEEYKVRSLSGSISDVSANFLYAAIVSNTLNFKAQITHERDETAAFELKSYTTLPSDWVQHYYSHIERNMLVDLKSAIEKDTKSIQIDRLKFKFSQLELFNVSSLFNPAQKQCNLAAMMDELFLEEPWLLSLISIEEGCNYIFTNSREISEALGRVIKINSFDYYLKSEKLWLRKEILAQLMK